jgi:hypothetical protein
MQEDMTQGRQPQQTAEAVFELHAGELRTDPFPGAWAGDHADIGLPPDLRQNLAQIGLLHIHRQPPFLDHDLKPLPHIALARVLRLRSFPLGPGSRAGDKQEEKTRQDAADPVSCGSVIST